MFKNPKIYQFLFAIFLSLTIYSVFNYFQYNNKRTENAIKLGESKRDEIKEEIVTAFDSIEKITTQLAEKLSVKNLSKYQIENLIKKTAKKHDFCLGITAAYEPVYKDNVKILYAPFYIQAIDEIKYIEESYDYTIDSTETNKWYTQIIKDQKGSWSKPFIAQVAQEMVVEYGVPIYTKDNKGNKVINGIVSLTISSAHITEYLHKISLGKTGFAFISTKDNVLIAHPSTELLLNPKDRKKALEKYPERKKMLTEKEGHFTSSSLYIQEEAEFFFTEINKNLVLSVIVPMHDLIGSTSLLKKKLIYISIFLTLTIIFFLIFSFKIWEGNTKLLWYFSTSISLLFLFNIFFFWYLNQNIDYINNSLGDKEIKSRIAIDNYLKKRDTSLKLIDLEAKSVEVPTGVFLYDIDFKNAYDVAIIGKIWMKIPDSIDVKVNPVFVFPQASATGISVRVRPLIEKKHIKNYWFYRYDFNATIQFDFDYLHYPLNLKKLDFQIKYPLIDNNIVLTPDLQSYDFINPSSKPGISNDIYIPDHTILSSYFTFNEHNFNSNLGNDDFTGLKETPILTFNILMKNIVINPIISNIVPVLIIAIMLFLLPFTIEKANGEIKEGGALNIVQAAGGFFFVLIIAHIQLRNSIETPGLTYLESLYFIMYLMLAIMATSVLLYIKTNKFPLLEYKHNLIFKLSFWPILLISFYLITLFIFY